MIEATITSKGRITIPRIVRERLGLHPGSKVVFTHGKNGEIVITPKAKKAREVFGMLASPGGTSSTVREMDEAIGNLMRKKFE